MENEKIDVIFKGTTVVVATVGIVVLDAIALTQGIGSTLFTLALISIAGFVGYEARDVYNYVREQLK